MNLIRPLICLFLLLTATAHAGVFDNQDLEQAYSYLNTLRQRAGMTPFSTNSQLQQSAVNHANYLTDNSLTGHGESNGDSGFTGTSASERAIFAGYHSLIVGENVSAGNADSKDSIDKLMGAIYHRFGFLDFVHNEIGIGIAKTSLTDSQALSNYVYNMGNSQYNTLCQGKSFTGTGSYYVKVCQPDIQIEASAFANVEMTMQGNNPNIVLWPADGDKTIPPAFFEESPDPLPDYSVSGYPISIQFNPLAFQNVQVADFKLYRESDNKEIQPTRLLTQNTDPNSKLSALDYVLFPLQRLEWNTAYRAEAKYIIPTKTENLVWRFQTQDLGVPVYTVQGKGEVLSIPVNIPKFAVYVPPTDSFATIGGISYRYQSKMTIEPSFADSNTLLISLSGNVGQEANFTIGGERTFTVKIAEQKTTVPDSNNTTASCQPATLSSTMKVHIPNLIFTPAVGTKVILWADLEFKLGLTTELKFKLINYGITENQSINTDCEVTTLSNDLKMHIPTLSYTVLGIEKLLWADLEWVDDLSFKLVKFGLK
jgi:hypothetical protein